MVLVKNQCHRRRSVLTRLKPLYQRRTKYKLPNFSRVSIFDLLLIIFCSCSCFQLFRIWNESVGLIEPELYFSHGYCKMGNYMDVSSRDFSNWLIAAITAERIIVLAFPFQVPYVVFICKETVYSYDFSKFMFLAKIPVNYVNHCHIELLPPAYVVCREEMSSVVSVWLSVCLSVHWV